MVEYSGTCDWCRRESDSLRDHKDFEEGFAGQSYSVCPTCIAEESRKLSAELLGCDDLDLDYEDDDQPYGFEPECYMDASGQCSAAGSEHCDWDCPNGGC